jgi:hypothetical protein
VGCDGTLPLGDLLALLAAAHEVPVEALTRTALPAIRHLAERGMLRPALR